MFKHILIPLDGSRLAESALPAAAFLSEKFQATATLVHIIEKNAPSEVHGQSHLTGVADAETYLKSIAEKHFLKSLRIDCHVHATAEENVAESIVEHTGEFDHDLIVMCSHGRGRALHLMLGSMAQQIIAMGTIPVLITRPDDAGATLSGFSINSVLAPLDGVPDHEQSLPVVKMLAKTCPAAIRLAVVVPQFLSLSGRMSVTSRFFPGTVSRMLDISVQHAESYLQALVEKLMGEGFDATGHVRRGDPADQIFSLAQQLQADLIVLATHGKSGLEAFWAGSVAHRVCSRCGAPILLIPVS